jgi:ATP-dependent DNA helicase RecQ
MATCNKNGISPDVLSDKVYGGLVAGKLKLNKPLERWLVIEVADTEISDKQMQIMLENIEDKRKYKHELLDYEDKPYFIVKGKVWFL